MGRRSAYLVAALVRVLVGLGAYTFRYAMILQENCVRCHGDLVSEIAAPTSPRPRASAA
jgi:hypothetical protein